MGKGEAKKETGILRKQEKERGPLQEIILCLSMNRAKENDTARKRMVQKYVNFRSMEKHTTSPTCLTKMAPWLEKTANLTTEGQFWLDKKLKLAKSAKLGGVHYLSNIILLHR